MDDQSSSDNPTPMALPFFYLSQYEPGMKTTELTLDEDNSRHVVQVLRMQPGEALQLTDGNGTLLTASVRDNHKKKCVVTVLSARTLPPRERKVTIAISPLKNASRFEWFLEKATEIGISEIIPLLSEHTERQHTRQDRLESILISAMLQSQQSWLPVLHPPTAFTRLIEETRFDRRLIAHCLEAPRPTDALADWVRRPPVPAITMPIPSMATPSMTTALPARPPVPATLILIGPEGDFSSKEVEAAMAKEFVPVTLGSNRLRTETAGIVAATLLCIG
jgi:16S rRNA (uracil1498-N3)-methyltransferase